MKKIIALLLAVVMMLSVLAACNNEKPVETQGATKPAEDKTPIQTKPAETVDPNNPLFTKPTEDVELEVWYAVSGVTATTFEALVNEYLAANPNVKINISYAGSYADCAEKISANLLTGTAPDVALMSAGPLYTGAREDWTIETLIEDPSFDKNGIYDGVWEYAMFQGRICALPYGISVPVLYYNKAIIEKAGIDLENNAPKTWDELYELAVKAQKDGGATNGFDCSDVPWLFKSMLNQNGNTIIDTTSGSVVPAFNDDAAVEVGEFWQKLTANGVMPIDMHNNADNTFLAGETAFIVSSSVRLARWSAKEGVPEFGVLTMPAFEQESVALGGNVLVCFPKEGQDAKLAAAWDLLKFLMSEEKHTEFALASGYLPIYDSAMDSETVKNAIAEDPRRETVYNMMANSWSYWHFDEMGTMDQILAPMISEIENGADVQDTLDKAVEDLEDEM